MPFYLIPSLIYFYIMARMYENSEISVLLACILKYNKIYRYSKSHNNCILIYLLREFFFLKLYSSDLFTYIQVHIYTIVHSRYRCRYLISKYVIGSEILKILIIGKYTFITAITPAEITKWYCMYFMEYSAILWY